jgi:tRNA modification GTPase
MVRARGTTIAAIASPAGGAARGVVRISGPRAGAIIAASCTHVASTGKDAGAVERRPNPWRPGTRGAVDVEFHDGVGPVPARVLWFPGPRSFTCEDVAELHVPGAAPLVRRALQRVLALGATLAEPGEFTRRAFEHGRIDLSRAEGVLALVEARTRGERRAATALLLGGLEARLAAVREELESARALVEASLDFDESDTGHVPEAELSAALGLAHARLAETLVFEARRELARGEARVVLVGEPNAGKSALFNALTVGAPTAGAGAAAAMHAPSEDVALVADVRGTTRDTKHGTLAVGGRRVTLVDTAGLELADPSAQTGSAGRRAQESLQRLAEERTLAARAGADLLVLVVDARRPELLTAAHARRALGGAGVPVVLAWNQIDREAPVQRGGAGAAHPAPALDVVQALLPEPHQLHAVVATSAVTHAGVAELAGAIVAALAARGDAAPLVLALAARTHERLEAAAADLDLGRAALAGGAPLDLVAQHLRDATAALDALAGRTTPEDLLDRIFARFCLGK